MTDGSTRSGREWDYLGIPNAPHSVEAETGKALLLTVGVGNR